MSSGAQTWKHDLAPAVPPKMSTGGQNMKTKTSALSTVENESQSAKYENGTQRPQYRRKWVRKRKTWKQDLMPSVPPKASPGVRNTKTIHGAIDTAQNGSRSAKHNNSTRRPRYRQKWVQERKTWKRDPTPSVPPKTSRGAQNMKAGLDALGTAQNKSRSAKH
jgi:hypothetical protein